MPEQRREWLVDAAWVLVCVVLSSLWCVTAAKQLSATFDEPFYVANGLKSWRTGSFKSLLDSGVMPLPTWVEMAPVYLWERLRGQEFDPQADLDTILPVARAGALVFWWLLLGYGWYAGRQVGGPWGGRFAIALLAFEPTLISNAALATTDIAAAACLLAFLVHYRLGRTGGWWMRVGIPTLWFAVAVLAKTSGLVFGLMGMVFFEVEQRLRGRTDLVGVRARAHARAILAAVFNRTTLRNTSQVFWFGILAVFVFCGSQWLPSPSFVKWAHQQPEGWQRDCWTWVAEHLSVFSNAGNGLAYQLRRNFQKQSTYLLGTSQQGAFWYFFPVSLSIKLPLALLALPVFLLALAPRSLRHWTIAFAGCLLLFSLNCRIQLGVRYMSPLIALICIGIGASLGLAVQDVTLGWRRRVLGMCAAAAPLWMAWTLWSVWPNGMCYVNELWGGPERGHLLTADADWGQGLKELLAWSEQSGDDGIDMIYFGMDPRCQRQPFHLIPATHAPQNVCNELKHNYFAVGTGFLYSSLDTNVHLRPTIHWLREQTPVARTSTFLIYDSTALRGALATDAALARTPRAVSATPASMKK